MLVVGGFCAAVAGGGAMVIVFVAFAVKPDGVGDFGNQRVPAGLEVFGRQHDPPLAVAARLVQLFRFVGFFQSTRVVAVDADLHLLDAAQFPLDGHVRIDRLALRNRRYRGEISPSVGGEPSSKIGANALCEIRSSGEFGLESVMSDMIRARVFFSPPTPKGILEIADLRFDFDFAGRGDFVQEDFHLPVTVEPAVLLGAQFPLAVFGHDQHLNGVRRVAEGIFGSIDLQLERDRLFQRNAIGLAGRRRDDADFFERSFAGDMLPIAVEADLINECSGITVGREPDPDFLIRRMIPRRQTARRSGRRR